MHSPDPVPEEKPDILSLKFSFKRIIVGLRNLIFDTFNIRVGVDYKETSAGIVRDIPFKGHQSWILVFSIIIASVGLNVGSAAVIIGAMLISPLMGPILGLGYSIGTNDFETFIRSLKNMGVMVLISLVTSTIFFWLSPLAEPTAELTSRIKPTLLDVLVALFGGLAGIIAGSRKEKSNVVPGVAIATALMPPLCTAGFGLANGEWEYFLGALYLFLLNSVFISTATYIVVRYLRFPLKEFVNPRREKKIKSILMAFVIIVIVPSAVIFYSVIKESFFFRDAELFIQSEIEYAGSEIINTKLDYDKEPKTIEVFFVGDVVPQNVIDSWSLRLSKYDLEGVGLKIHQQAGYTNEMAGKLSEQVRTGVIEDIYKRNQEDLSTKQKLIDSLQIKLTQFTSDTIPVKNLLREIRVTWPEVSGLQAGNVAATNDSSSETQKIVLVSCTTLDNSSRLKLEEWLRIRLDNSELKVFYIS